LFRLPFSGYHVYVCRLLVRCFGYVHVVRSFVDLVVIRCYSFVTLLITFTFALLRSLRSTVTVTFLCLFGLRAVPLPRLRSWFRLVCSGTFGYVTFTVVGCWFTFQFGWVTFCILLVVTLRLRWLDSTGFPQFTVLLLLPLRCLVFDSLPCSFDLRWCYTLRCCSYVTFARCSHLRLFRLLLVRIVDCYRTFTRYWLILLLLLLLLLLRDLLFCCCCYC